jgi:hypothetical protein
MIVIELKQEGNGRGVGVKWKRVWKRMRATSGNCTKGKDMVSTPGSRNLSLDQNVQRHILGVGVHPSG